MSNHTHVNLREPQPAPAWIMAAVSCGFTGVELSQSPSWQAVMANMRDGYQVRQTFLDDAEYIRAAVIATRQKIEDQNAMIHERAPRTIYTDNGAHLD